MATINRVGFQVNCTFGARPRGVEPVKFEAARLNLTQMHDIYTGSAASIGPCRGDLSCVCELPNEREAIDGEEGVVAMPVIFSALFNLPEIIYAIPAPRTDLFDEANPGRQDHEDASKDAGALAGEQQRLIGHLNEVGEKYSQELERAPWVLEGSSLSVFPSRSATEHGWDIDKVVKGFDKIEVNGTLLVPVMERGIPDSILRLAIDRGAMSDPVARRG